VPVFLKVDISPICNLHCTICVHARPSTDASVELKSQRFRSSDKMSVADFDSLIAPVAGRTVLVSLYYLGDPLVHPHLDEICRTASGRGLNTHVSTNFSFHLSDSRLRALLESGLTHLTVCMDGLDQASYSRTRVGGDIDLVVDNLRRLTTLRRELHQKLPHIEVQYVKFRHNLDQVDDARRLSRSLGVDSFSAFWGGLHNYTDRSPRDGQDFTPRARAKLPRCRWPHFAMVVKFDGEVIPCCVHRIGAQYSTQGATRSVGNALESGLLVQWNSDRYRAMRRLVSDPTTYRHESDAPPLFCEACPKLFQGEVQAPYLSGEHNAWEALYERNEGGHVIRRVPSRRAEELDARS
jgi:MoaA/NifB/PqqE/SkfB family radical SAM enzyme